MRILGNRVALSERAGGQAQQSVQHRVGVTEQTCADSGPHAGEGDSGAVGHSSHSASAWHPPEGERPSRFAASDVEVVKSRLYVQGSRPAAPVSSGDSRVKTSEQFGGKEHRPFSRAPGASAASSELIHVTRAAATISRPQGVIQVQIQVTADLLREEGGETADRAMQETEEKLS